MSLPVVFRPAAQSDLLEARDWYDRQQPGLGDAFSAEINAAMSRVAAMPEMFAVRWQDVRACRPRRFPYLIYYRALADRVEVLAVLHASRDPSVSRSREP